MLKKKQPPPLPSSSSRRENPTDNQHAKAIGCMTGILQIVSKYQRRRNKFLTFGKKQEKQVKNEVCASAVTKTKSPAKTKTVKSSSTEKIGGDYKNSNNKGGGGERKCDDVRRSLRDVPRSPTIPSEIRKSNAAVNPPPPPEADDAELKRRKLLEALEKCDEDLKLLKKMIVETARSAEHLLLPPIEGLANPRARGVSGGGLKVLRSAIPTECESEEPSPVSVIDEFVRSQSALSCRHNRQSTAATNGRMSQQQKPVPRKKPGEEEDIIVNARFFSEPSTDYYHVRETVPSTLPTMWSSKAMIESVDEVCRDIAWGEKREVGRIGLALQDNICRDLVQEVVKELLADFCSSNNIISNIAHSLPLQACRRSLHF